MAFQYLGLRAKLEHVDVTEEEVNRQLVRLQQQSQRRTPVFDRPSQNGDELVLDYAGFADGKQFAGGTAEKQTLVLGSGTFIPGFEEQLLGKNPGDDVTVHVTFPAAYHAPELAGKDAEFRCHIHEIRTVAHLCAGRCVCKRGRAVREYRRKCAKICAEALKIIMRERAELELRDRLLSAGGGHHGGLYPRPRRDQQGRRGAAGHHVRAAGAEQSDAGRLLQILQVPRSSSCARTHAPALKRPCASRRSSAAWRRRRSCTPQYEEDVAQALSEICRANHMTMEELQPYYDDAFAAAVEYSILLAKVTKRIRESAVMDA